jgi:hypothetical protein
MNKFILLLFLFIPILTWAEVPKPDWAFVIKGFHAVDLAGIETDAEGNVYACGIYSGWMEVPGLKERFQAPNHVAGFLLKISNKGKIAWALPFLSSKDTRIQSMDLLTDGGVVISGFMDSGLIYPSNDGKTQKHSSGNGCFIANYSKEGNLRWTKSQQASWGEAPSIAADSSGNIYYAGYYTKGFLGDQIQKSDSVTLTSEFLLKLSPNGDVLWQKYFKSDVPQHYYDKKPRVRVSPDQKPYFFSTLIKDKVLVYSGSDVQQINSTNNHSGYVMVFDANGNFVWTKQFGGRWAHPICGADFDAQGNLNVVTSFGSEFYISNDDVSSSQETSSKPSGASSGIAWFTLDNTGRLVDIHYQVEKTGAFSTNARFLEMLPDGSKLIGGEFTNILNFKSNTGEVQTISGQISNHNAWMGAFDEASEIETLWQPLSTTKGFSFPTYVSNKGKFLSTGFMCYEEQDVQLKSKRQKVPPAERDRFTIITSGVLERKKQVADSPILLACSDSKLYEVLLSAGLKNRDKASTFLDDEAPGEVEANLANPVTSQESNNSETSNQDTTRNGSSLANNEFTNATLFPNPTNDFTKLKVNSTDSHLSFSLFSSSGCLLLKEIKQSETKQFDIQLNVSALASGTYLLVCESGSFRKVFRLIRI